jgi:hypothetical protein
MSLISRTFSAILWLAVWPGWAAAQDIYRCVDAEGRITLQNTGKAKGCEPLNVQPVLTVTTSLKAPAAKTRSSASARPVNFPRVDADAQRARDSDRKRILDEELLAEETRLASLLSEFNGGSPARRPGESSPSAYQDRVQRMQQDIRRGENNVASLKREIALLQRQ